MPQGTSYALWILNLRVAGIAQRSHYPCHVLLFGIAQHSPRSHPSYDLPLSMRAPTICIFLRPDQLKIIHFWLSIPGDYSLSCSYGLKIQVKSFCLTQLSVVARELEWQMPLLPRPPRALSTGCHLTALLAARCQLHPVNAAPAMQNHRVFMKSITDR